MYAMSNQPIQVLSFTQNSGRVCKERNKITAKGEREQTSIVIN